MTIKKFKKLNLFEKVIKWVAEGYLSSEEIYSAESYQKQEDNEYYPVFSADEVEHLFITLMSLYFNEGPCPYCGRSEYDENDKRLYFKYKNKRYMLREIHGQGCDIILYSEKEVNKIWGSGEHELLFDNCILIDETAIIDIITDTRKSQIKSREFRNMIENGTLINKIIKGEL